MDKKTIPNKDYHFLSIFFRFFFSSEEYFFLILNFKIKPGIVPQNRLSKSPLRPQKPTKRFPKNMDLVFFNKFSPHRKKWFNFFEREQMWHCNITNIIIQNLWIVYEWFMKTLFKKQIKSKTVFQWSYPHIGSLDILWKFKSTHLLMDIYCYHFNKGIINPFFS